MFRSLINSAFEFAFPWSCSLCSTGDSSVRCDSYCNACYASLTQEVLNSCQRCAAEVGQYVSTADGCVHCRKYKFQFSNVTCLGMYKDSLRYGILSSKWSFSSIGVSLLAELLAEHKHGHLQELQVDLIVPIPQSWQSRLTRRFNSACLIAEEVARSLNVPCDYHILSRRRNTRPQKRVPVEQRFQNQREAFRVRSGHVLEGKTVLIVDDVMTTGATCSEAARVLREHGAAECHVAILARVLDNSA